MSSLNDISNNRELGLVHDTEQGVVSVTQFDEYQNIDFTIDISTEDFITMLKWYFYQKEKSDNLGPIQWEENKQALVDSYIEGLIHSSNVNDRVIAASKGFGLDKLVKDESISVRAAVARQGYCLDVLINDEHWYVRSAVAAQGYGLDVLVNDKDEVVRKAVAENTKDPEILNKLVKDENRDVCRRAKSRLCELEKVSVDDLIADAFGRAATENKENTQKSDVERSL